MSDPRAQVAFIVQGFAYRMRWAEDRSVYLEMLQLDDTTPADTSWGVHSSESWVQVPDGPETEKILEHMQHLRMGIAKMAGRWVQ
jgi:hypothetical protein